MEKELLDLRQKIIESARQIAMSGDIAAETRLNVLLELSKDNGNPVDALSQAFNAAQGVASDDDKLNAYLDILYEIDSHLAPAEHGEGLGLAAQSSDAQPIEEIDRGALAEVAADNAQPLS